MQKVLTKIHEVDQTKANEMLAEPEKYYLLETYQRPVFLIGEKLPTDAQGLAIYPPSQAARAGGSSAGSALHGQPSTSQG